MSHFSLDQLPLHTPHEVIAVATPAQSPDWAERLGDIGFLPGERVTVTARGAIGGDPLVVRVGLSTFALRRAEAACVQVRPLESA